MVNYWLFSSYTLDHIRTAYDRLIWGFTDPKIKKAEKYEENWSRFKKFYDMISVGDIAVFQYIWQSRREKKARLAFAPEEFVEERHYIHGLGVAQNTFHDDQNQTWRDEIKQGHVKYPWRVNFSVMLYSESPITEFTAQEYITGYGIGKLAKMDVETIVESLGKRTTLKVKFSPL